MNSEVLVANFAHHYKKRPRLASFLFKNKGSMILKRNKTKKLNGVGGKVNRHKNRRGPLPMKLRALPKSFWQQPNKTASMPPGTEFLDLPPLAKENDVMIECNNNENQENKTEIITDANTDLLFSLFQGLDNKSKGKKLCEGRKRLNKRGRPKNSNFFNTKVIRDDDPYLVNNITENLLPLIPSKAIQDSSLQKKIENGQKILAMSSDNNDSTTTYANNDSNYYSQILTDLIVQL